jgi:hypothetical protein
MESSLKLTENIDIAFDDRSYDFPQISNRDLAITFLSDIDYEAQLSAIRSILERNKEIDLKLSSEIKEIERDAQALVGISRDRAVDEWVDCLYSSVYQDAAHSMAAVGMLAPFIESLFYQGFQGIRQHFTQLDVHPTMNHERWKQAADDMWDCHYILKKGRKQKNLVQGILQLASAVGLIHFMPYDWEPTLKALFEYRNKMFHCGFEWPVKERINFETSLSKLGWPNNSFRKAVSGGEPWAFYITDTYIAHCLDTVDKIIDAFGAFARVCHSNLDRGNVCGCC